MANELKESEIGLLPANWGVARLGDIFDIKQGKALSRKKDKGISPVPFLRTANVSWGRIDLTFVDEMDFTEEEVTRYALKPGDLLVCEGGDIGRTAIWEKQSGTYCYQNHLHRLRPKTNGVLPLFYMFWMQAALLLLRLYQGTANRTTIANLSRSRLSSYLLPLPPLPEQRRIATALRTIQDAIAAQDDVIAAARELKRSLMERLFTYGPGREPAPTKETEIGEIPAHWRVQLLGQIAQVTAGATPTRSEPRYWQAGTIPWVKTGEVDYGLIKNTDERITESALRETPAQLFPSGTLLLAMYGQGITRGKVAILGIAAATNQACAAILPRRSGIWRSGFLYYYLTHSYSALRSVSHGTQQLNLSARIVGDFPVPIAPLSEQDHVIASLGSVDGKIAAEEQRKAALEELFRSALEQLMTGQIRLTV